MKEKILLMFLSMFAGMGIFLLLISMQVIGVNISSCEPNTVAVKEVENMFNDFTATFFHTKGN